VPCTAGHAGEGIYRRGNGGGTGLGNRFAQEVYERVVDARIADATRSEQKFHDSSPCRCNASRKAPPAPRYVTEAEPRTQRLRFDHVLDRNVTLALKTDRYALGSSSGTPSWEGHRGWHRQLLLPPMPPSTQRSALPRSSERPAARRDHCEIGRPLLRKPSSRLRFGQPSGESSHGSWRPYTVMSSIP